MKIKLLNPIVSIVAGILVLAFPDLLRVVIGGYLIVVGVLALMNK
jgi:uncharacterized membrane protein HdeD (DUF308 family)